MFASDIGLQYCVSSLTGCPIAPFADTMNQAVYVSLSLIGLVGIVGAGVAVGSGVGMMTMQLAAAEQEQQAKAVAHSPVERKVTVSRGFAAQQ